MKGSTEPPHDFRLYMPLHRWRFGSSCFCPSVSQTKIWNKHSSQSGKSYELDLISGHERGQICQKTQRWCPTLHCAQSLVKAAAGREIVSNGPKMGRRSEEETGRMRLVGDGRQASGTTHGTENKPVTRYNCCKNKKKGPLQLMFMGVVDN